MDKREDERKTYFVAVGAGQILEDKSAAPFEFEIRANEEELNKLQEMFEETSSADEAAAFHFSGWLTAGERETNALYDAHIHGLYRELHRLGTDETKLHIEAMDVLGEA